MCDGGDFESLDAIVSRLVDGLMEDAGPREEHGPAPVHDARGRGCVVNLEEWRSSRAGVPGASAARLPMDDGRSAGVCRSVSQPDQRPARSSAIRPKW